MTKPLIVPVDDRGGIAIESFDKLIDTDKIVYYELKPKKDGCLIVKFYDAKKKLIKPYDSRKD